MNREQFEKTWHNKWVRPKGTYFKIPIKNYIVTSALYKYEDDITIFAIMAEDYDPKTNKHFFTIRIKPEDIEKTMKDFEVI